MEPILKTLKDYASWKSNLKSVLDKNIGEVISLATDAVGTDQLIPFETTTFNSALPSYQNPPYQDSSQPIYNKQVIKGMIINVVPNSNERLVWFYNRGNYHLINHGSNSSLNLQPILAPGQSNYAFQKPSFIASFDIQIDFLLAFVEWLPQLAELLANRMERIDPKKAESDIKAFVAATK
jgi:hypothetical protein